MPFGIFTSICDMAVSVQYDFNVFGFCLVLQIEPVIMSSHARRYNLHKPLLDRLYYADAYIELPLLRIDLLLNYRCVREVSVVVAAAAAALLLFFVCFCFLFLFFCGCYICTHCWVSCCHYYFKKEIVFTLPLLLCIEVTAQCVHLWPCKLVVL